MREDFRCGRWQRSQIAPKLGQQFGELARLDEARILVVMEVPFGKRAQPHELNVVRFKKAEICQIERS